MLSGDLHLKNINYGRHNNTRDERIESEKILTITRYNKKKKKKKLMIYIVLGVQSALGHYHSNSLIPNTLNASSRR